MIIWNYRVFSEPNGDYIIREVFYTEDGAILGCTAHAVEPFGKTIEELAHVLDDFRAALQFPVLTLDNISQPSMEKQRCTGSKQTLSHEQLRTQLGLNANSRF
jgi:hypothetical protein